MTHPGSSSEPDVRERRVVTAFLSTLFALVVIRHAWLGDDAFVTFRVVDNFVHGHGLRWNVAERVQAFTHPLWAMVVSAVYAVTREIFFTAHGLSVLLAWVTAALIVWRLALTTAHAVLAMVVLVFSRAVVEYSSSGLENTLTHLLLALLAIVFLDGELDRARLRNVLFVASLCVLNRLDTMWLVIAPVIYSAVQASRGGVSPRQLVRDASACTLPVTAWLIFAVVYYGFPFPNTAYAKLGTGISLAETSYQGGLYVLSLVSTDAVSALALIVALWLAVRGATPTRERMWLLGVVLYTLYIVRVGGDFMQGRFFSAPVVIAAIGLARAPLPLEKLPVLLATVGSVVLLGGMQPQLPSIANRVRGVSDERGHYFRDTALLSTTRTAVELPDHVWARDGAHAAAHYKKPVVRNVVGMFGFRAGPRVHVIDIFALADPLLARMPAMRNVEWRIGHFERAIPEGYIETLHSGHMQLQDSKLGEYYAALRTVITGPLWSWERVRRIWQLNTGALDHLIDHDRYRHPKLVRTTFAALGTRFKNGAAWDKPGVQQFGSSGLEVALDNSRHDLMLELSVDSDDRYEVTYFDGAQTLGTQPIEPSHHDGLRTTRLPIAAEVASRGYDRIRIYPVKGKNFSVGHLTLLNPADHP